MDVARVITSSFVTRNDVTSSVGSDSNRLPVIFLNLIAIETAGSKLAEQLVVVTLESEKPIHYLSGIRFSNAFPS